MTDNFSVSWLRPRVNPGVRGGAHPSVSPHVGWGDRHHYTVVWCPPGLLERMKRRHTGRLCLSGQDTFSESNLRALSNTGLSVHIHPSSRVGVSVWPVHFRRAHDWGSRVSKTCPRFGVENCGDGDGNGPLGRVLERVERVISLIQRSASIGAHVLLSTEVRAVLDTKGTAA
jgi:hypothetical protein